MTRLENETNPSPRARKGSQNPGPLRRPADVYVSRKVRVYKNVPTTNRQVEVTASDLYSALGATGNVVCRVDGAQAWNVTNSARTTNYVGMSFNSVDGYTGVDADGSDLFSDWGAEGSCPSVKVDYPKTLTTEIAVTSGGTASVLTLCATPAATFTALDVQTLVCDVYLCVKY